MPTPPLPSRDDDEHVAHGEGDGFRYYAMLYRVACDVEMGANGPTVADPIRTATGALQGMLHEAVARANTAKVAAELMRARAERAEALLANVRDYAVKAEATCREAESQRRDDLRDPENHRVYDMLREQRYAWEQKASSYAALVTFIDAQAAILPAVRDGV